MADRVTKVNVNMASPQAVLQAPSEACPSDDSASYWDFGDRRDRTEDPIHRIHSYPAKFPAFITTKALEHAERQGVDVKVVADVFCGCGTTAVEAKTKRQAFLGLRHQPGRHADRESEDPVLPGRGSRTVLRGHPGRIPLRAALTGRPRADHRPRTLLVRGSER